MDLRMLLIQCVREAQAARKHSADTFNQTVQRYELSPSGREAEAARLFGASKVEAEAAKERGFAAIDAKCAELDKLEQDRAAARAADFAYLNRLESKLRMITRVEQAEISDADLKAYFAEYENDPVAISAILRAFKNSMRGAHIAPANTNGERQKHLQTVVKAAFETAMNRAGAENPPACDLATGAIFGRESEVEGFITYVQKQNDEFSRPDVETWDEVRKEQEPGSFGFNFKSVR